MHNLIKKCYEDHKYELVIVPLMPVPDRIKYILELVRDKLEEKNQ